MAIYIQRDCGCIGLAGSDICPECGYDPECPCCILSEGEEEEACEPAFAW